MAFVRLPMEQWIQVQMVPLRAAWSRVQDSPVLEGVSFETFCELAFRLSSGRVHDFDIPSQGEDNAVQDTRGGLLHRMFSRD